MILVILTAFLAVCGAAKLDTSYLPPISARTAGGSLGDLLAPLEGSSQGPTGSYTNEVQGVVVDAVNPGTRTSGQEPTGLGGSRISYGSTNSKVGDAAFNGPIAGLEGPATLTRIAPGFNSFVKSNEAEGDKTSGNSLKFTSDVELENYSYGFEADNGISVGEHGEAADGVKAQGGFSYKGDDGKTYSVSYTADEGGYKPQGQHLPTPPPIPNEILISLEKNAKEEAAGHVDNGSYDAQKYNDGDYSSNGAGSNNGASTIGGGDATSSGSYVSQSGQAQRPTSGVLVGTYKPGSVASQSSQEHSTQGFAQSSVNQQSGFSLNKDQSGSQGLGVSGNSFSVGQSGHAGQSGFSSQSTDNRFGVQSTLSEDIHAHAQATVGNSPARSPSFQSGASAYSSAVSSGSGSASAFASTGSLSPELKNEHILLSDSFGSTSHRVQGTDSSAGVSFPAPATASASASGSQTQLSGFHTHGNLPNLPNSASASASVSGNQQSQELTQQVPSRFGESQKAESSATTGAGAIDGSYASSTQKPFISQQQGSDNSYYYKHPSKPFVTPTTVPSNQFFNDHQTNFPISSITQQGTGFSEYNGITQAAISPFTSDSSSAFTQVASQSSQFGLKPSIQFGQSSQQTSTQFGSTEAHSGHKPIVQSQKQYDQSSNSQNSDSSQSQTQQYQGTIYTYNKPATTLPATNSQAKPSQIETDSRFKTQQGSSQFGSQSTFQQTQTGSKVQTSQFSQKPIVGSQGSGSSYQFSSSGSKLYGQKPFTTQGSIVSSNTNTQNQFVASNSHFGQNSQSTFGSGSASTTVKPISSSFQYSQFGSTGSRFGQNSQSTAGTGSVSTTTKPSFGSYQQPLHSSKSQTTQGSSFTYGQSQTQYGNKPVSTTQTGVTSQHSQLASNSQFGQNGQPTFGSGSVSTTAKPIGSSFQYTQFGSTGSRFGQNSQSTAGTGLGSTTTKPSFGSYQQPLHSSKPQTTQGSSFTYSQSQTQYGNKPVSTTQTGVTSQHTQLASNSQFGQNSQSTFGSGSVSTTVKPTPSSFQYSQFGSTGSRFGQNSQSTAGTGSVSTTTKPSFGSYQQPLHSSKPQTTQGSSFTYGQSQTQYGNKPVSTTQTGVTSQYSQLASNSQFGQNGQPTFGSGSVSTTAKPIGSSFQYTQFGSTGSRFGQNSQSTAGTGLGSTTTKPLFGSYQQPLHSSKPQTTQGSSFTYSQSQTQYGNKPVSTTQTGVTSQHTQLASNSQFGQNSQSTFGSGSVSTTVKPISSSFQYSQFGSTGSRFGQNSQSTAGTGSVSTTTKPSFGSYQQPLHSSKSQTTQGSSFTYGQSQTQYGNKPVSTTQTGVTSQHTQFASNSQFGQNGQPTFGSGSVSTTAKPIGSSFQYSQFGSTGSRFGQNSQSTAGTGSVSTTTKPSFGSYQQPLHSSKPQTTQGSSFTYGQSQTQYGNKPVSTTQTGVTSQHTQLASNSQFGQNSQSTFGSGSVSTTVKPISSSFQYSQFGSTGSRFGQNSQSTAGTGSVSTTTKPSFGSYQQPLHSSKPQTTQGSSFTYGQSQTQYGNKPVSTTQTEVTSQHTQFASNSQFGQNGQPTFGSGSVSTTAKPIGSSFQYSQFGSTGSRFGQNSQSTAGTGSVSTTTKPSFGSYQQPLHSSKPQTTQGSSFTYGQSQTQYGNKPVSTTQTGGIPQHTQLSSGSQFGQNSQFTSGSGSVSTTPKPLGSSFQYTQFGSTGSRLGQNSQTSQGSALVSGTPKPISGIKPVYQQAEFGPSGSQFGLNTQSAQSSVSTISKPSFGQTSFGSATQNNLGTFQAQPVQTVQYGISSQNTQKVTQFGSTPSRFGESSQPGVPTITTISQTAQPSPFAQQPIQTQFGSTAAHFGQKPQASANAFASSSSSNVVPFGSTQTISKYQQNSQFGAQNQGIVLSTQKPTVNSLSQTNNQQYQYTQSKFGQGLQSNVGSGQVGQTSFGTQFQKPFGSQQTQTTYQQTQITQGQKPFGSSQGSAFQIGQSAVDQPTQGTVQTSSVAGYNYKKPQTVFTTQYGGHDSQDQKVIGSSQFGSQPVKLTDFSGSVIQTTYNQFSGKPFQPASTVATQGSVQSQSSAVSTSQPTKPTEISHVSGQSASTHESSFGSQSVVGSKPEYSIQPSQGVELPSQGPSHFTVEPYNPSVTGSTQVSNVPSRLGSNEGVFVSNVQSPIIPVPGYEIVTSNHGASHGFVGQGEQFGGPRDPPRFDDKTGYHY